MFAEARLDDRYVTMQKRIASLMRQVIPHLQGFWSTLTAPKVLRHAGRWPDTQAGPRR